VEPGKKKPKHLRKEWPQITVTKKNGQTYYVLNCRKKGWTKRGRLWRRSKKEILDLAREIERDFNENGVNGVGSTSAVTTNKELSHWERQLKDRGKTMKDAVSHYLLWLDAEEQRVSVPFLKDLFPKWYESKRNSKLKQLRPRTIADIGKFSRIFLRDWGDLRANELTKSRIEVFVNGLKKESGIDAGPHARFSYATMLSQFFNWCIEQEILTENPAEFIRPQVPFKEPAIYTIEQCKKILLLAQTEEFIDCLPQIVLGLFGGVRPEEAAKLEWSQLTATEVSINAGISKTKRGRRFIMESPMPEWLNLVDHSKPLVPRNIRYKMRQFRKCIKPWLQDALRHSFASYWLQIHQNRPKLAEMMGNSVKVITDHYHRAIELETAKEFWTLTPDIVQRNTIAIHQSE
jgi:integrase/recombinase XerD